MCPVRASSISASSSVETVRSSRAPRIRLELRHRARAGNHPRDPLVAFRLDIALGPEPLTVPMLCGVDNRPLRDAPLHTYIAMGTLADRRRRLPEGSPKRSSDR